MTVEITVAEQPSVETEGMPARELLSCIEKGDRISTVPRESLHTFLITDTEDFITLKRHETDVLHAVGLSEHPMSFSQRSKLADSQKRVLIIGATKESINSARELLQRGVAVVMVDSFPGTVQTSLPLSDQKKSLFTPDVFHHPLMLTVQADSCDNIQEAQHVFHGVLINRNADVNTEVISRAAENSRIFHSATVFSPGHKLSIDTSGRVVSDEQLVGRIGLRHDQSLGRIYIVGEETDTLIQAARAAVLLRVSHERARARALSLRVEEQSMLAVAARAPRHVLGVEDVHMAQDTAAISEIVADERLPGRALNGVSILHREGIAAFERAGFTREQLRKEGITVMDGSELTGISESEYADGIMVARDWWVTAAQKIKQTETIGAVIVANSVETPDHVDHDRSTIVLEIGDANTTESDRSVTSRLRTLMTPTANLSDYEQFARWTISNEEIPLGRLELRQLITQRQEHLVHVSHEALAHLFTDYGHRKIAEAQTKASMKGKRRPSADTLQFDQYMIAVGEAIREQARFADVSPNSIGYMDISVLVPRYGQPDARRKRVNLGVRVLHDGSVQMETAKGVWERIENVFTTGNGDIVVDHRRSDRNNFKPSAEAKLINHILARLHVDERVSDANTKFAGSIFGLRAARRKHLVDLVGSMYPVHSRSPAGAKGSAYQTPGGGIRLSFHTDGSSYKKSLWINAQGIVYRVGNDELRLHAPDADIPQVEHAERFLSFTLVPERIEDVTSMHERAVRELFTTSMLMMLSPLTMDLQRQDGLDHTASMDLSSRLRMHKYRSGLVDKFGTMQLYYAVDYTHQDGSISELQIRVMENGTIMHRDEESGSWVPFVSNAQFLDHITSEIGVAVQPNQYVVFPLLEFFSDGIHAADHVLQKQYIAGQAEKAGLDPVVGTYLEKNAPIVFDASGNIHIGLYDRNDVMIFDQILSDRKFRAMLRKLTVQELHVDTTRFAIEKAVIQFEETHGVQAAMLLSGISSMLAVIGGADASTMITGGLSAGGLGLLSMYAGAGIQTQSTGEAAQRAGSLLYRAGEYLLFGGVESAVGSLMGHAINQIGDLAHQSVGQAAYTSMETAIPNAPNIPTQTTPMPDVSAVDSAASITPVTVDSMSPIAGTPIQQFAWGANTGIESILGGQGWVNGANGVSQAQVIQHYILKCVGPDMRTSGLQEVADVLDARQLENIRQIIATSSYREYLQAVVNGLYQ